MSISALFVINTDAVEDDDSCCFGYEKIDDVNDGNCYRMLIKFGPLMQNQARMACGLLFGGHLVTFQDKQHIEKIRDHFYEKYQDEMANDTRVDWGTGFWTGYSRGNDLDDTDTSASAFIDGYSGEGMSEKYFRDDQPNNLNELSERSAEACLSRKQFSKKKQGKKIGLLDDYPCSKDHYAICMLPGVVATKKYQHIYNTAWQNFKDVEANACEQNWELQASNFFEMAIDRALRNNKSAAVERLEGQSNQPTVTWSQMVTLALTDVEEETTLD